MYKFIKGYFDQDKARFAEAMNAIFAFIEDKHNKDRGQGFVSLGNMSTLSDQLYNRYLPKIIELISKEIKPPEIKRDRQGKVPMIKPNVDLDCLKCVKDLLKKFGDVID